MNNIEAMNVASQCRATASNPLAQNILVDGGSGFLSELLLDAAKAIEQAEQAQPVSLFDWLPEGATHTGRIRVRVCSGGKLEMRTHAFKYDNGVLKVYVTDNDNEYPGWREAKDAFFHLNFPVLPFYTSSPPRQPEPLTNEEIGKAWAVADGEHNASAAVKRRITRAIEAAHGIKENT